MNHELYHHVIIVGIDGAGHFFKEADTPYFDRIFENGCVTYKSLTSFPSISAECWCSMLTGVSPRLHGRTNEILSSETYPLDSPYPSLWRRIHEAYPDYVLGSYCDWHPITDGCCETNLPVARVTAKDTELTPMICEYIEKEKPNFLFIQMDSVDHAGHHAGYGSKEHIDRIHVVDSYIGNIYESVACAGILEDTLFIVIADHGGTYNGEGEHAGHGGWTENERLITFALTGKTVQKAEMGEANARDISAIVLYALGIKAPDFNLDGWTSQIPAHIFDDAEIPAYQDISGEVGAPPRVSETQHHSSLI